MDSHNTSSLFQLLYQIVRVVMCIIIPLITVVWVAFSAGLVSRLAYPYGWWAVAILVVLGMLVLNIVYFIWALPSLLVFFIKNRSKKLNYTISLIYIIGMLAAAVTPWFVINQSINIPQGIVAVTVDVLIVIFYKRKIVELFEPE